MFKNWLQKFSLLAVALVLVGCSTQATNISDQNSGETAAASAISFTDMAGREIELAKPAAKIVALTPSDAEILFTIDAGDKIVGRGEYVDFPEETQNIPSVGTDGNTNLEQIINLKPEVVILSPMTQTEDQMKALEDAGITVVVENANTIEQVYTNINDLGKLTGNEAEAENLVDEMKATFKDFTDQASRQELAGNTVYYEISPLEFGLWTGGKNTFMNEIGNALGLKNVFGDLDSWAEISEEQVIEANPDYIITTSMPAANGSSPVDEIKKRPGWENINAVKNNQVFQANSDEFTRPGPRLMNAVETLYNFIYEHKAQ